MKVAHGKRCDFGFFAQSTVEKKRGYMFVVAAADVEVELGGAGQQ